MIIKSFSQSINDSIHFSMRNDQSILAFGLGINDPKSIFDTTNGLEESFGSERVFDMPTSENAMTGIAIGLALDGFKPIMTHQRLDFFLLALDQLVNSAAKWHYMFGGRHSIPITIRLIIGRGWGQGPTHSQSLQAWFAHIPGLKIVMPSTPQDAQDLLLSSINDPNPVIFLEHRWLHNLKGKVKEPSEFLEPLGKAKIIRQGSDITIISMSLMTIEAIKSCTFLSDYGIESELINLRSIKPMDWESIFSSIKKTGRLLVLDTGMEFCSIASEIITKSCIEIFAYLKVPPQRIAMPDCPVPTGQSLTKNFYPNSIDIVKACLGLMNRESNLDFSDLSIKTPHDVPGDSFKGPF